MVSRSDILSASIHGLTTASKLLNAFFQVIGWFFRVFIVLLLLRLLLFLWLNDLQISRLFLWLNFLIELIAILISCLGYLLLGLSLWFSSLFLDSFLDNFSVSCLFSYFFNNVAGSLVSCVVALILDWFWFCIVPVRVSLVIRLLSFYYLLILWFASIKSAS